ncbi:AAA domain-containing protein [Arsenophonus endosymbiont of Apis mellifera]|uniref:AAA domain-containing protein n=1 Tax=Arsenophonus endosymbiont of Apis mellifera TaxID=1541805 RepID=UPI0015D93E21|nr:AAA domain-containing protein [Arsenophonus endosymbiont of Apis mellifera]
MEVKYWEGGLEIQEVNAIEKLEKAFSPIAINDSNINQSPQSMMAAQTETLTRKRANSMWPWKGYAGFRFVNERKEGEFDLVIVTHKNILVIELKDWRGEITSYDDNWYQNGQSRCRSPVHTTRNKVFLLKNILEKIKDDLPGKKVPWIDFKVVLTNKPKYDSLPEKDKLHILTLEQFMKLTDPRAYDKEFNSERTRSYLNKDFSIFDKLISGRNVRPKQLVVNGFRSKEEIFSHPSQIYKEFQAVNENNKKDIALLRHWKFSKIEDYQTKTPDGRYQIVSRERDILNYISCSENELYKNCLRSISNPSKDDMTQEYCELYELPAGHLRFNSFIDKYIAQYSKEQRLVPVKTLLNQFSLLHGIKVAHRDIGCHSIWLSPTNSIALSNFITAYYQPAGTMGPKRNILNVGCIPLPEEVAKSHEFTPFTQDVFCLGVLSWHILKAKRLPNTLSLKQIISLYGEIEAAEDWYAPIILQAISMKRPSIYPHAKVFLEAFNEARPDNSLAFEFDDSVIEPYRQHSANPYLDYPVGQKISSNQVKQIYRSGRYIVKLWTNANPTPQSPVLGQSVAQFLQKVDRLQNLNLNFLPKIQSYGIAPMIASLFLVTEFIEGYPLDEIGVIERELAYPIIDMLISNVERLHELNFSHGDLHPGNVLVTGTPPYSQLFLIDIPDFNSIDNNILNTRYSPLNIDTCSPFERDNFAVMRMSIELLGMNWDESNEYDIPPLRKVIEQESSDRAGFLSLDRFKDAFVECKRSKSNHEITILVTNSPYGDFKILPDNGRIYIRAEKKTIGDNRAVIHFCGIGGSISFIYSVDSEEFSVIKKIRESESVSFYNIEHSMLERNLSINVVTSQQKDFRELNLFFKGQIDFALMVSEQLKPQRPSKKTATKSIYLSKKTKEKRPILSLKKTLSNTQDSKICESLVAGVVKTVKVPISADKVWRSVLDTEAFARPAIEVAEEPRFNKNGVELIIFYSSKHDVLSGYEHDEILELTRLKDEKQFSLGNIVLEKSNSSRITLEMCRGSNINVGETLYITNRLEKSSFKRREKALTRVLAQQSVIPRLISYFEPHSLMQPTEDNNLPTEEDFCAYERTDSNGTIINLNDAQKLAFKTLIRKGPVGFLQGPPGTGKTEFIAAFCHYLISKMNVKNILMVSQSHEAVNTAAERIRSHCQRLHTELDIVRFSNRENAVSESMLDVYSKSLVARANNLFKAEYKQRLCALSKSLGVNADYIARLADIECKVRRPLTQIRNIYSDLNSADFSSKERGLLRSTMTEIRDHLVRVLSEDFNVNFESDFNLEMPLKVVRERIACAYGIAPHEAHKAQRLVELANNYIERLSCERSNYEEFLLRSKTMVCGTCVGIGLSHLNVSETFFDWIIIDEAARSSPSELAIAMQSGKRVLLVGDHKQLPPIYQREHEDAIARQLKLDRTSDEFRQAMASDFEKAFISPYGQECSAILTTQYRMQQPIGDLVSNVFYGDVLQTGNRSIPRCFNIAPDQLKSIVTWINTGVLGEKAFHKEDELRKSLSNQAEITEIITILRSIESDYDFCQSLLDEVGDEEPVIGVICMYSEQKRMLHKEFHSQNWRDDFLSMVKIDTVDSYQGKENRIVIVSLVRSNAEHSPGFLKLPNRINVAMSRAMDRLIIIGDLRMWFGKNSELPLGKVVSYIQSRQTNKQYIIKEAQGKI